MPLAAVYIFGTPRVSSGSTSCNIRHKVFMSQGSLEPVSSGPGDYRIFSRFTASAWCRGNCNIRELSTGCSLVPTPQETQLQIRSCSSWQKLLSGINHTSSSNPNYKIAWLIFKLLNGIVIISGVALPGTESTEYSMSFFLNSLTQSAGIDRICKRTLPGNQDYLFTI